MRDKILDFFINRIKKKDSLTESEERICRYALYSIYSFFTKISVIVLISLIFNIFIETILLICFYSILRFISFGLHATKNLYCWISSIIVFVLFPLLIKYLNINIYLYYSLFVLFGFLLIKYTPADTPKRPLIKKEKRDRNQKLIAVISIILLFITIFINNTLINNAILFSIFLQSILINPISYKIVNVRYNNYLYYKKSTV